MIDSCASVTVLMALVWPVQCFLFFLLKKYETSTVNYWILHSPDFFCQILMICDLRKSPQTFSISSLLNVLIFSVFYHHKLDFKLLVRQNEQFEDAILALCNCDLKRNQKWKWLVVSVLMKIGFRHEKCLMLLQNCSLGLAIWSKTKTLRCEKTCRMSTKSFDLSSSFFLQFVVAFDLWQQGQGGWVTLLGAGRGQGKSLGLGHKLMKVSNLDTRVN